MRELVINAFAHRSYIEHDAPVFIAVYDTRVEITSPGGLPRGQTVERAIAGFSKIRNEMLAKALNYMRIIEEWGSGLRRVNGILRDYGTGTVELEDAGLAVRMNVRRNTVTSGEAVNPKCVTEKSNGEAVNEVVNEVVNGVVNQIYLAIKSNPGVRKPQLLKIVATSRATTERSIAQLRHLNKVEFRGGAPKTGGYYCK